jgi:hypothetical protein
MLGDAVRFEGAQIPMTAAFGVLTSGVIRGTDFIPVIGAWNASKGAYAACSALVQDR